MESPAFADVSDASAWVTAICSASSSILNKRSPSFTWSPTSKFFSITSPPTRGITLTSLSAVIFPAKFELIDRSFISGVLTITWIFPSSSDTVASPSFALLHGAVHPHKKAAARTILMQTAPLFLIMFFLNLCCSSFYPKPPAMQYMHLRIKTMLC